MATESGLDFSKVLMCIKLTGSKCSRTDYLKHIEKNSFVVAEILLKDPDNPGIFYPSAVFDFRCLEQVLYTVKTKSASATSKIIAVDCLDLKKAIQLSSAIHCIEIHNLARPSRNSNLPEVITLFRDSLEENTLEELKYFCKKQSSSY